jgi:hypothetical protein
VAIFAPEKWKKRKKSGKDLHEASCFLCHIDWAAGLVERHDVRELGLRAEADHTGVRNSSPSRKPGPAVSVG